MEVSKWRRPGEEELTRNWRFLYNEHKIISYIKVREIRCLGHVAIGECYNVKVVLNRRFIGRRRKGRPRKR